LLLESAARVLAAQDEGIGEVVRQDIRQNRKGGTTRKHGNHQGTTQTTEVGDGSGPVEESVKEQLDMYAKFIDSTPSYVITEALKVLFKRDDEFKSWLRPTAKQWKSPSAYGRRTHRDRVTQ
jgi:predicted transcriptional regulator